MDNTKTRQSLVRPEEGTPRYEKLSSDQIFQRRIREISMRGLPKST
jgi:hypothetical protein